ncbi:S-adenosyl-L-methionine-dependent methyltransferase [Saitoella complicata NRRL Y-17804]|uniref:S-adenosyl-L-methionine-dependent methyltransferase n=1 Tax=Saitoella complicata (strain BCRC 22490 / CBS 7301 / JCM 7358 / NBRC 10748 / NRRL Y-17804) TaxID=698492 RepID=UPI000867125D|nr:S-adenosyl-L-methionine-dependent methyltransferase [Saitoella complicata NRRL Y-17804]ODQ52190.1 S-adenosyl-L-methionine-dependent methyltransferase [Saitoella complicata NRRL Y-17804]
MIPRSKHIHHISKSFLHLHARSMSTKRAVHPVSASSFSKTSSLYDSARPSYIPAAVDTLLTNLNLTPNPNTAEKRRILELGAGTGKFTKLIQGRGYHITATEPAPGMLEVLRQNVTDKDVKVVQADAYDIPLPSESVDAVIVAQAFHWFADRDALREIHRVLKPKGRLGLVWNYHDVDGSVAGLQLNEEEREKVQGWYQEIVGLFTKYENTAPQYRHGTWLRAFDTSSGEKQFFTTPLAHTRIPYTLTPTPTQLLNRVKSMSYISTLPAEKQEELMAQIMGVLWRAKEGRIVTRERVDVYWTERIG